MIRTRNSKSFDLSLGDYETIEGIVVTQRQALYT